MDKNKLTVYKANKLVEASYSNITLHEQLLLLAVIGRCDPRKLNGDTVVFLTVSEFADLVEIEQRWAYKELKEASERLFNRYLTIDAPDPDNPELTRTKTRWVHSIDYFDGQGKVGLYFAPKVIPYLSQLKGQFTKYKLQHVSKFKSGYGVRLYELLIQWQCRGSREIEVDWLRENWQLSKSYSRLDNLKKYVIQPAIEDINSRSNLWVKFGQRKSGRKVIAFQFQFGLKSESSKPCEKKLTREFIEKNARVGESWEEATARLSRHN